MIGTDREKALILIVDDDISMRMLMRASLQQAGYEVAEAENGRMAVEQFKSLQPDALLLDVMMPEMDGFETCAALRELPGGEHTPVLMVTGLDDVESLHHAFEVGATDFITKPINWAMLGYRVRYMLRASQSFLDLHQSQLQLAEAQQLAKLGNWEMDLATEQICGSAEFYRVSGLQESTYGTALEELISSIYPTDREAFKLALTEAIQNNTSYNLDYRIIQNNCEQIIHHRGEVVASSSGKTTKVRGFVQEVTELRKAEQQIRYLAYYDGLTGLANRELFRDRLNKSLAANARQGRDMALFFLDLDRFKRINDTLGHHIGDLLLKNIAERIKYCVRDADSVARFGTDDEMSLVSRLGGDEFTVLLTELRCPQDAAIVAQRILDAIPQPLNLQGHELYVTSSIGISMFPTDGQDADTLLKNADTAMYEAKKRGRNNFQFYDKSMNTVTSERLSLENDLRSALELDELLLHYQPQVDMQSGQIVGAEALLRWHHPTRGLVMPSDFIPLAEESGLIIPMTEWVIEQASKQNREWQQAGFPPIRMAINISGQQFKKQKVTETTQSFLQASGADLRNLEVELTESSLMENRDVARETLEQMKSLGLTIAIDDFGTGYSSLAYLKAFPIDTLKIDRSFVRDITTDPNDEAIIKAVVAMAHSLELKVIAEGVETEEQLEFLQQLGCNEYQGYLFSRPLPKNEFTELLKKESSVRG